MVDFVAVVVLDYLDVPGYGSYKHGEVAGFERSVAEALIQQHRVRRFQEATPTTPAPSTDALPEQAPKPLAAEPTPLAPPPEPAPAAAASSPRAQEAAARTYIERALLEPRPQNPASWPKPVSAVTALPPGLAAAMAFLREVLRTPRPATEVKTLARQHGISLATLRRAKKALGVVKAQKRGMRAGWIWMIREGTFWG